jgi:sugar phosphate isomerase/epimerase
MKVSIITDEVSADPETAIELGAAWGVRDFELRGYFTDRAPCFSGYQKRRLRDLLADHGARIAAVSPGLFKIAYPPKAAASASMGWMDLDLYRAWDEATAEARYHLDELLPASLDYANELGAELVVIFSFNRGGGAPGAPPDGVLDCLSRAAERTREAGLTLVIETEDGFWADTGARSAELVRAVNHPALGINWDPANSFCAGDNPYPTGYQAVRELVRHVHFKDARRDSAGSAEFVVEGEVDWAGQIEALAADGYEGFISVETHLRPRVATARRSLDRLRTLIADARAQRHRVPEL